MRAEGSLGRSSARARGLAALLLISAAACSTAACSPSPSPDARLSTPQGTVEELLGAYGLAELDEESLHDRLTRRAPLHLADPLGRDRCVSGVEREDPLYEAYLGYVVANLARGRGALRYQLVRPDETQVLADAAHGRPFPITLRRDAIGWRVDLRRSFPDRVRREIDAAAVELRGEPSSALSAPALPAVPELSMGE